MSDDESTSAALRRAEQERDTASQSLVEALDQADDAERECDELRAELASARQELDAVRTARDNLDRELAEARAALSNALHCFDDLQSVAGRKYQELEAERDEMRRQRDEFMAATDRINGWRLELKAELEEVRGDTDG